jgi:bifunctional non-homologous end joining protein LigD
VSDLFEVLTKSERDLLIAREHPEWLSPMLATLTDQPFSDPGWVFERKLDGERCLVLRDGAQIRLRSRNRQSLNESYPEIEDAIAALACDDLVLDGEVVAFDGSVTSFQRLQQRMQTNDRERARRVRVAVYFYAFDLPHVAGQSTEKLPLRARKKLLKNALRFQDPLRFTTHRNQRGKELLNQACHKGWEGLIAKDAASAYVHSRSRSWLKFKCVERQEMVIGGFTDPQGDREGFGALLLGYWDDGELVYAGKVGTGFDDEALERLGERLEGLERKSAPFDQRCPTDRGVHWVRPDLVCEVGFTEWTSDGRLRHARFLGLRRDKDPRDVVREVSES